MPSRVALSETTAAARPPTVTEVPARKFVPVTTTGVPPVVEPLLGVIVVIVSVGLTLPLRTSKT